MDGEGVEAWRLDVGWLAVSVVCTSSLLRGEDGCVGVASSCASPLFRRSRVDGGRGF